MTKKKSLLASSRTRALHWPSFSSFVLRASWFPSPPAFLPGAYIAEAAPRIQAYRKLAEVTTQEQLDDAAQDLARDRFGPLARSRGKSARRHDRNRTPAANARRITQVEAPEGKLILTRGGDYVQIGGKFPRLTAPESPAPACA